MNLNLSTYFRIVRISLVLALSATLLSFTATSAQAAVPNCSLSPLVNGNFEIPNDVTNIGAFRDDASLGTYAGIGWRTTEPSKKIEFWPGVSNPANNGSQFIELNGDNFSGVYQDFVTAPGATLTWSLLHKGRDGVEQMAVRIGPATGSVALPLASSSLLIRQGSLIGNSTSAWGTRSGSYVVPAGQTVTRFYLESVSITRSISPGDDGVVFNDEGITISSGNHVDNVTLTSSTCEALTPATPGPPPPSFLKVKTSPSISLAADIYTCTAGTLIFWRHSVTEEPSKLAYQKISLLRNGEAVSSTETLKPLATFEKNSAWVGSTMTCQVTAIQEHATGTFTSLNSDKYNELAKAQGAAIKAADTKYFSDRAAAHDKKRVEMRRISDARAKDLSTATTTAQTRAAEAKYRAGLTQASKTWKAEIDAAIQRRASSKAEAPKAFTQGLEKFGLAVIQS
jgi:hypothetical protein